VLVVLVTYLSLTPEPVELKIEQGDKFLHALAYLVLMSYFANLYDAPDRRRGLAAGFVLLGIGLEFLQRWTGYRSFELADMAAGVIGVSIGWALAPPRTPNYLRVAERLWRAHS
jgi:VanZ family protein